MLRSDTNGERVCSNFKAVDSYVMYTNDNRKGIPHILLTNTVVWQNTPDYDGFIINGKEYHTTGVVAITYVEDNIWEIID